jgi:nucleotide-binding universal stress UspA family protein
VRAAIGLARPLGLRLALVYVAEDRTSLNGAGRSSAAAELERLLAGLPIPPDSVRRIEVGDPAERVVAAAEDERAALILTGTRSKGARAKAVFGSVAARIVELAPVPVVVVPPACCESAVAGNPLGAHEVIIAVDGSSESRAVTALVGALARRARAAVVLAHIVPPPSPAVAPPVGIVPPIIQSDRDDGRRVLDEARRVLPDLGAVDLELRQDVPAHALEKLASERGADLIAVGTSCPGRLQRTLAGSLADELAASSRRLVMVVPHEVAHRAVAHTAGAGVSV